ncbi:MAG TPA: ester cyclase [Anaerolineae bacterium]|nr:ester cyclase [Anaerolineae bacterium]
MSEQENIKAAHAFFDAWNAGDLSKTAPYEADDFMAEGPGAPGPMNREQNRMYSQNFLTAFPGSKFEVLLTIAQGDYIVTHWKAGGGAHTGPLTTPSGGTIPPTGKTATVIGSTTSQIKNGKITRSWTFWDMASLLGQLGLLPPM